MFDPTIADNDLPLLPPQDLKLSDQTYLQLSKASRVLATLNTYIKWSNEQIGLLVLGSFLLTEWVASNAIENINTTLESVFQADISSGKISYENKEVLNYRKATLRWIEQVHNYWAIITNTLIEIQSQIEPKKSWIRKIPWTVLMNGIWDVIYTPPVGEQVIRDLLSNLEQYINTQDEIDPLIKLAIIHYQFESIHPFPDGNGRTGRILMILYLVLTKLLDLPILYLSEYINEHKAQYYKVLQWIRTKWDRDALICYILVAVETQSDKTIIKLQAIQQLIQTTVQQVEEAKLKIPYSFITSLFNKPYNNIKSLEKEWNYSKNTIKWYLRKMEEKWIIERLQEETDQPYIVPQYLQILYNKNIISK
jgi:Fic family protein